jgi:hypothetical protein
VARTLRLDTVEHQQPFRLAEVPGTAAPDHDGQLLRPEIPGHLDLERRLTVLFPRTAEIRPTDRNSLLYCFHPFGLLQRDREPRL